MFFYKIYSVLKKTYESYHSDNKHFFDVQVADTPKKREIGLMYITKMNVNSGMLFDYKKNTRPSLWMKNTKIPLDAIFIDSNARVVDFVENMKPNSLKSYTTKYICRYVLEVNSGTVKSFKIKKGDIIGTKLLRKNITNFKKQNSKKENSKKENSKKENSKKENSKKENSKK